MAKLTPAFRYTIGAKKGRRVHIVTATIWPARPAKEGDWESRVTITGVKDAEADFQCAGVDGLQTHILGLVYIRAVYRRLAKAGYIFVNPYTRTRANPEWSFAAFETK